MHRSGDQQARCRHFGQCLGNILRKERFASLQRGRRQQRQQHRHFHAVHVLRRYGGYQRWLLVCPEIPQRLQILRRAGQERAPGLEIGAGHAGATRGEADRYQLFARQLRHIACQTRQLRGKQETVFRQGFQQRISQAVRLRVALLHIGHHRRRT
ncbi:hypothetical protein D3C81_1661640 [compost metagenome]